MQARRVAAACIKVRNFRISIHVRTISNFSELNATSSQVNYKQPVTADKKRPEIKRDIFRCKDFDMMIPHTCIENKTEEGEYFVKCTSPERFDKVDISSKFVEEEAIELFEKGYVPLKPGEVARFEHSLKAILNKVFVSIYEVKESGIQKYFENKIGVNKRLTIPKRQEISCSDNHCNDQPAMPG